MTDLLLCHGLSKHYGSKKALEDVNLLISTGRIVGLLGPNGSGKTSLLKMIAGLLVPTSGTISVLGNSIGPDSKKIVSYLPDRTYLNENMTINEILNYFKDFYDNFEMNRALEMLNNLSIDRSDKLKSMSKGTREKVQLILVMSRKASLYLLDEPIAGVDPAARDYIIRTVLNNYDTTASVIISTHLIQDVENILDDIIFLQNGKIKEQGAADDLKAQYGQSIDEIFREEFRC